LGLRVAAMFGFAAALLVLVHRRRQMRARELSTPLPQPGMS